MPNINLTPGQNIGLTPRKLRQTLGAQGGQEITAYIPDPSKFTGVAGTEYAPQTAPNLQYVADTIYKQYKDAQGNLFELVPSQNPGGLSDPQTYLRQLSGTPQGYAQTPQQIIQQSRNLPQGWEQDIYGAVKKTEYLNILPGETEQAYYKRTGIGYSPAFGGQMPAPITTPAAPTAGGFIQAASTIPTANVPTAASIQQGINDLLARIQKEGITGAKGEVLLAPGSLATQAGQIIPQITAERLGQAQVPIDVTGTTPATSASANQATAIVAGADATLKEIQDYINLLTPPETPESKKIKDLTAQIEGMLPSVEGRGAAQLAAEQEQGVQAKKQALLDVQNQIMTKMAEYKALSTDVEGKPITMASIIGAQAQIQRVMASDIGLLQAQAQVLQGNLTLAQETANRAVDLKYSDAQDAINVRLQQLKLLESEFTKTEKIRANAIEMYLQNSQQQIEDNKAQEKQLTNYNLSAMRDYPSANIQITDDYQTTQQKILGSVEYKAELAKKSGDGVVSVTPDDKRDLLGAGFTTNEIPLIVSDINTYGIDAVLEGITDKTQRDALRKVYGIKEESKLTRESISSLYGLPDNNERTNWLGSFFGIGKTNKEKLDDIMKIIKQYQDVGMSDSEILTLIKKG